jgi:hypothetical protein
VGGQVGTGVAEGVQVAVGGFTVGLEVGVKEGGEVGIDVGKGAGVIVGIDVGKGAGVTVGNGV